MENLLPIRKKLAHGVHPAARFGGSYFLTICCQERGRNQLCQHDTAASLLESAQRYHEGKRWWCRIVLLMPDHLHALIGLPAETSLSKIVGDFKHVTAKFAGVVWQKGFFDHRIRHDESLSEKAAYIQSNPVRAGLILEGEPWPYCWRAEPEFAGGSGVPLLPGADLKVGAADPCRPEGVETAMSAAQTGLISEDEGGPRCWYAGTEFAGGSGVPPLPGVDLKVGAADPCRPGGVQTAMSAAQTGLISEGEHWPYCWRAEFEFAGGSGVPPLPGADLKVGAADPCRPGGVQTAMSAAQTGLISEDETGPCSWHAEFEFAGGSGVPPLPGADLEVGAADPCRPLFPSHL